MLTNPASSPCRLILKLGDRYVFVELLKSVVPANGPPSKALIERVGEN